MSDAQTLIRTWLDAVAMGPAEAWDGLAADDLVMRLPYAPPGVLAEMNGLAAARENLSHHWPTKQRFEWCDLNVRETEEAGLFVVTGRSDVLLASGQPYRNDYVILIRLREGLVVEHVEYFNPLPIIAMLGGQAQV